ncbi:peptidyl-Lys metalloendopeptidase [Mycena floridula]|nr:peptidyl-Lys metalloendopeptidase [Mycena floridula]
MPPAPCRLFTMKPTFKARMELRPSSGPINFRVMFSLYALVFSSLALSISAQPGLILTLSSAPSQNTTSNSLQVVAKLANAGNETLTLFNEPGTILCRSPTDKFHIIGAGASFKGIQAKYSRSYAMAAGNSDFFTVIPSGDSVDVEHDLSEMYNFKAGTYGISTRTGQFHYVQGSAVVPIVAVVSPKPHIISLPIDVHALGRRSYKECDEERKAAIQEAVMQAEIYAKNATSYLSTLFDVFKTPRFTTWFGNSSGTFVLEQFQNVSKRDFSQINYDCACHRDDFYAFVNRKEYGRIILCGAFWRAPLTGTDSKAGTLVHEISHFEVVTGTEDDAYGQIACEQLARETPSSAVMNADSHEYFAENTPFLT